MNIEELLTFQGNDKVVTEQRRGETCRRTDVFRSGAQAVEPLMSASAMAYPQLGYPYSPTHHQFLMTSSTLASCLEPGGRSLVDPLSPPGHSALSCPVYESRVLTSPGHELTPTAGLGVYSGAYKSQGYYSTCASDATALYSRGALDSKDGASAHVGASQTPAYYPYDYAFGQYPYDRYGYTSSDVASRRKNATRETTSTLKTWLQEHQKNPYPTKGEKIMLAIITKMTLTQVSTWFANARRRLKKENKVTWSPRANKSSDERGCDDDSDGEEPSPEEQPIKSERQLADNGRCSDLQQSDLEDFDLLESDGSDCEARQRFHTDGSTAHPAATVHPTDPSRHVALRLARTPDTPQGSERSSSNYPKLELDPRSTSDGKPKIWSIAQTAASLNPGVQPEYLPCMLSSSEASYPGCMVNMGVPGADRGQDSPVASLREWVDGVFHDPALFQQRPGSQTPTKLTAAWKGSNGAVVDTLGRSFEHVSSSLQQA